MDVTGNEIFARARTIATQTMTDANVSSVIDARGGLRALLNHSIREVYRRKARDIKFRHDITETNTVTMVGGQAAIPDNLMREFLKQSNIKDENDSLVTYLDYQTDANQTFDQLAYLWIEGDTFYYRAPAPDLDAFDGDVTIECPTFPTFPGAMTQVITFPSQATIEDVILFLSQAILDKETYQVVSA